MLFGRAELAALAIGGIAGEQVGTDIGDEGSEFGCAHTPI